MKREFGSVQYGKHVIKFTIVRSERRTLEIAVEPDASVVITAPIDASLQKISDKVRKRAAWVRRQQDYFAQFLPRTTARQFLPGETHLYLGRHYRLKVVSHIEPKVKVSRGFIVVQSRMATSSDVTRDLVERWYHERALVKFRERLEFNLSRFFEPEEFRPKALIVRQHRCRWGSLSPASRLLLNRRLIEAPVDAIDYVITHELCHIAEPHHGPAFFDLLERVMPDWSKRKERLEKVMA